MKDILLEETSVPNESKYERNYILFNVAKYFFLLLAILVGVFFFWVCDLKHFYDGTFLNLLLNIAVWLFPFVFAIIMFLIFRKKCLKVNAEYDYSFLTGSIRVAMIPRNKCRIPLISFDANCVEKIGKVDSPLYNKYKKIFGIKFKKFTANNKSSYGDKLYYIVANFDREKHLFVFDCSYNFIQQILRVNPYLLEKE